MPPHISLEFMSMAEAVMKLREPQMAAWAAYCKNEARSMEVKPHEEIY
jgi:hypothetical protein